MAFDNLSDKLAGVFKRLRSKGKLSESDVKTAMREVRLALLEADVNYTVVKEFTNNVKEKALGEEVQKSLKPGDVFVKIVKDELTELLGDNTNVYVDMNGDKVILKVDPHRTPKMDTSISFTVPYKGVYLFDAETEEIINKY